MLTLLLGRSGAGKTETMLRRLGDETRERPQLLLVPEQHSHDTERRLCRALGSGGANRAEVLSFTRLYSRVCDHAGGGARPYLDAGGRLLLMYTAVAQVRESLTVYRRPSAKSAFLTGLLATADECKSYRVSPRQLLETGELLEGLEGEKLRDLGLILQTYDALTEQVAADPRDRLTRLAQAMADCGWPSGCHIWADHFTDFTPQELEVLSQLLRGGNDLTVLLTCDGLEGEDIFDPARRTAHTLLRLAAQAGSASQVEVLKAPARRAPALVHLEENLFAQTPQVWQQPCPELKLFEADSLRREVEYAASLILHLVREKGWRFRDFIVTARQFERYAAQVESVFAQCDVPLFLSTVTDILEKPVLTLITAALDTVSGGYRQEDLFRYLKTGLTDLEDDQRDKLENYALTWDLRGSRWTAQADWAMHPAGYGQSFRPEDEQALVELNASRRQVVEPLERLRKNKDKTGRGYTLALYRLLEEIGLPTRLETRAAELEQAGERKLADEYRQLWDVLTAAMEQCALLLEGREMKLEEFSGLFKLVLSQYDVGTIPVSLDRVTAGDAPRLAHRRAKFLIFLGADDGSLPAVTPTPGLFSDREREMLAEQGLELAPQREEKMSREMSLVYTTCAVPSQGLLVSWSRQGEGEQHRPSFLVERLRALYPEISWEMEDALRLCTPGLALAEAGREPAAAAALKRTPTYAGRMERVLQAASVKRNSLSKQAVRDLYGSQVPMSATRMDACRSCHFSYFMRYGLRARERQQAGFHAPEYGSFVHAVLEQVLTAVSGGDSREIRELAQQAVSRYIRQEMGGMEQETPRFRWLFSRLLDTVTALAENAVEEMKVSHFRPLAFELGFGPGKPLPAIRVEQDGLTLSVSGYVDRVDGWERDGTLYLRVIDYKTGRKSFNFTDIQNGMSLQMLLYLFALEERGFQGRPVQGAGVLYVHARPVDIPGQAGLTEEECRFYVERELRREGLVLDDEAVLRAMEDWGTGKPRFLPITVDRSGMLKSDYLASAEQLGRLSRKVTDTLKAIAGEMAAGNIAADPYWRSNTENACRFCDYRQACHFESCFGDKKQWQRPVGPKEFWERLENGQEGGEEHGLSAD